MRVHVMKEKIKYLIDGFLSAFDLKGQHIFVQQTHESPGEIDSRAIASDWQAVGIDLLNAMEIIKNSKIEVKEMSQNSGTNLLFKHDDQKKEKTKISRPTTTISRYRPATAGN